MPSTIHFPERSKQLARTRQRWAEVLEDPNLRDHPYRIETNGYGQIIMTPPAGVPHSSRQGEILYQLRQRLGEHVLPECPISTVDGVKAVDVAWCSHQRFERVCGQVVAEVAPEICVEVLSPSNTEAEMKTKRELYFDAGAKECWQCDLQGRMTYYGCESPREPKPQSQLCPDFPSKI